MCRRVTGILEGDILDAIAKMDPHEQAKTNTALAAFEEDVRISHADTLQPAKHVFHALQ